MKIFPIIKLCAMLLIACHLIALSSVRGEAAIGRNVLQKETAEEHLAKGRDAYSKKQYKTARKELKRAINLKKDLPEAHLLLATIYRSEGKVKAAINHAKEAVKYQPDYPAAHYLLARLLFEMKDLTAAQQELSIVFNQNPRYASAHRLKGDMEIAANNGRSREEQYKAALESYEEALHLASPQDTEIPIMQQTIQALKNYLAFLSNRNDSVYERPILLNLPRPNYTEAARSAKISGTVILVLRINERGEVSDWFIIQGIGYGLDEEAIKTARRLRFSPAMKEGAPVSYWQLMEIEFNIK